MVTLPSIVVILFDYHHLAYSMNCSRLYQMYYA